MGEPGSVWAVVSHRSHHHPAQLSHPYCRLHSKLYFKKHEVMLVHRESPRKHKSEEGGGGLRMRSICRAKPSLLPHSISEVPVRTPGFSAQLAVAGLPIPILNVMQLKGVYPCTQNRQVCLRHII